MKNPFLLKRKNHGTNSESIHYYQINYNIIKFMPNLSPPNTIMNPLVYVS